MRSHRECNRPIEVLEQRVLLAVDFTIASITDTQYAVEILPQNFLAQTQWIANHAADPSYKIAFFAHQGDMLRRGYSNYQAANADAALDLLDGVVPYGVTMGNHDCDNQFDDLDNHVSAANFNAWFGDTRYQANPASGFGGSSLDMRNRYFTFNGGGRQYLVLCLEWQATNASIAWAQGVINSHRHLPVILSTHDYLNSGGYSTGLLDPNGNSGANIFAKLVAPNPQIFLVLSGHTGAVYHRTVNNNSSNADLKPVLETVGDFEGRPNAGDGWMQLFQFDSASGAINVFSYSPTLNQWDTTSAAQYSMSLDFSRRFAFASGVVANDDTFDTLPGQTLSASAVANDHKSNPVASLTATLLTNPSSGSLTFRSDGTFTYAPAAGFRGNVSFTYQITDGANTSNPATVFLRINTAPLATSDWMMIPEGRSVTLNVVNNDTDADGDALIPVLTSLPIHGAVFADAAGTLTYTPDPRFVGADTFTYEPTDGKAHGAEVTVKISVQQTPPVYDYPIAETTVSGSMAGSRLNLAATDGVLEFLAENASLVLDHRWQFNVTGGTEVTVCINGWRAAGADEYRLRYNTNNGSTWYDMTQIVPRSSLSITRNGIPISGGTGADPAEPYQMWLLPPGTSGPVYVRVTQTTKPYTVPSVLAIDELFIRSGRPAGFSFTGTTASPVLTVTSGTVTLDDDLGQVRPNCAVQVQGGTVAATAHQHVSSIELSGSGLFKMSGGAGLFSDKLTIQNGSVLDLGGGSLALSYSGLSPVDVIRQHIEAGRLLTSGAANSTLAQVDNASVRLTSWCGLPINNGTDFRQILVKRTLIGDTNLDGQVTSSDYFNIVANQGRIGQQWLGGDLNHDGAISPDDLALVSAHLGAGTTFATGPALPLATELPSIRQSKATRKSVTHVISSSKHRRNAKSRARYGIPV